MAALTSSWGNETRTYDANTLQLTRIQIPSALDLSYVYPAAPNNNGRISAEINNLTNTQVSYAYDQVNRLATAVSATGGTTNWGLSFSYDVYGNRTAQTVTAGTAPAFSATFGSNNRMVGYSYDNNGNQLTTPDGATLEYDPDNRLTKWTKQGQVEQYQYHPSGWRLSKGSEKYLYGPGGQLLESYRAWNDITDYVYFGGRLLYTLSAGQAVTRIYSDRLGSTRATETIQQFGGGWTTRNYYPFGEEITSTANDQYKFASTYRDSATGLDYAINRYYASGTGRFLTADPYQASGGPASPQSWNRYSYVHGDPVNFRDPRGLLEAAPDGFCPAEYHDCGGWGWLGGGWSWEGSGVRSGGAPDPLSVTTGNVLNQFPGLPFADAQTLGRIVLGGGVIVCAGSGVCEVVAAAAAGAAVGATVGYLIKLGADWIYATKADIKQVRDAARTVSHEPNCRPPTPDDYAKVHDIIKDQKGPDGKVPFEVLLDAWRQVLCK